MISSFRPPPSLTRTPPHTAGGNGSQVTNSTGWLVIPPTCAFRHLRSGVPATSGQRFQGIRSPRDDAAKRRLLMSPEIGWVIRLWYRLVLRLSASRSIRRPSHSAWLRSAAASCCCNSARASAMPLRRRRTCVDALERTQAVQGWMIKHSVASPMEVAGASRPRRAHSFQRRTVGATDVRVGDRRPLRGRFGPSAMQVVLEDRLHRAVGQPADLAGAQAGGLERIAAVGPGEPENAEAGPEALLGMWLRSQDDIHEGGGVGADLLGFPADLGGRHAGVSAMAGGHVRGHRGVLAVARGPDVRGDALAIVEDLDGPGRDPDPEGLLQELIRDRAVMLADLDVVVEPDIAFEPVGVFVTAGRQRLQRWLAELFELIPAAGTQVPGHPAVRRGQQIADRGIELRQGEEAPFAQPRDDPAARFQHDIQRWTIRTPTSALAFSRGL